MQAATEKIIALSQFRTAHRVEDAIDFVYPAEFLADPDVCQGRAILCTHNNNARDINAQVLASLAGDTYHLYSVDTVKDMQALDVDANLLNHTQGKGIPDHVFSLKLGALFMVIRNLNITEKLVNGTKVIVVVISPHLI